MQKLLARCAVVGDIYQQHSTTSAPELAWHATATGPGDRAGRR